MPQTKIISVVNQKGGVGKTTTAVNLSTAMAACGLSVLLVDFDPQGNASTGLGIEQQDRDSNSYRLVTGQCSAQDAVTSCIVPHLDILPATMDLSAAEIELSDLERREYRLADGLGPLDGVYDYILIDCPPSLGLLTVNALAASDSVLVPLQCEFYALEGLAQLMTTIAAVRTNLNASLAMQGIVLTMYDTRNKLSEMVKADVRGHFGDTVYETVIPRNVRISEAPSFGKPVLMYDLKCTGAQAYAALAAELLKQEKQAV
ncbi:MAG: Chromosome partitioning protein ParA [Alphaproteobacteria bacterium UBA4588]|nr:MAG: Chromosome partitioning protein ParA [Alphaproteobacteria bacterium UBA4588]